MDSRVKSRELLKHIGEKMKKIISLFKRDYEGTRQIYDEVVEGAEWVVDGEGVATEKIDGTSCLIRGGEIFKRYDCKRGKTPPPDFEAAQEPDPITGHWTGWLPTSDSNPQDKWHREGLKSGDFTDGTYELIGPKVQDNRYELGSHTLRRHGDVILHDVPRTFAGLKEYFRENPQYEGVVWHHLDGRLVKIKRRDFGLPWGKGGL